MKIPISVILLLMILSAVLGSQSTTKNLWEYQIITYLPLGMPLIDELKIAGRSGWEYVTVVERGVTSQGTPGALDILMKRRQP